MEFKTKIELSLLKRLLVNTDDMLKDQGNVAAKHIRTRIREGRDADGKMPSTTDDTGTHPRMNKSGEFASKIKRRGGRGEPHRVQATGRHQSNGQRNAAIAAIQVAKTQHDLFGRDEDLDKKLTTTGDKSLKKQLVKGEVKFATELKRIKS